MILVLDICAIEVQSQVIIIFNSASCSRGGRSIQFYQAQKFLHFIHCSLILRNINPKEARILSHYDSRRSSLRIHVIKFENLPNSAEVIPTQ